MGIFSSSKKVYVASTVYKMVDDDLPRPTFMQEALTSATLRGGPNTSLGQAIVDAHIRGPRSTQRSFFRWAERNYDFGMPRAAINYSANIDHEVVAQHISDTEEAGASVDIITAFIDISDESYFAERFLFRERESLVDTDWVADYDATSETINIVYAPGSEYPEGTAITSDSISVPGFNSSDQVLVAYYRIGEEPSRVFIYEIGSGVEALDSFDVVLTDGADTREFYPPIPIRIDNKSVFAEDSPAKSKEDIIRDAYEKSVGGEIDDLIASVEDNDSIGDIDYAYVVMGVSLNDPTKHGKRYIFEFLRTLAEAQQTTSADYDSYQSTNDASGYQPRSSFLNGVLYRLGAQDGDTATATNTQSPQITNIHLTLPTNDLGVLDMRISWADIRESRHTGVIKQDAVVGDVEVSLGDKYEETVDVPVLGSKTIPLQNAVSSIVVTKQINRSEFIRIEAIGLQHKNLIYDGKSVDISGEEAMEDEDESGFILPLHEPTMKRLGVVVATEVVRDSYLIVFNSYQVVKRKFYEKGIFKVFVVVVVIVAVVVLAVVTGGASLGPSAPVLGGVLGSSAAIGAALGFSGLLAIAVGTAVNVIAAMVITQLVATVATEVLGEKLGAIVAVVAQVALAFATGNIDFSSFSSNILSAGNITNLLQLTNAAANVASIIQQDQLAGIYEDIQSITEEHNEELDRLKKEFEAFGFGDRVIDPIMLTDFSHLQFGEDFTIPSTFTETLDGFIQRTLASGDDLAEMSLSLINDFAEVSLTLE